PSLFSSRPSPFCVFEMFGQTTLLLSNESGPGDEFFEFWYAEGWLPDRRMGVAVRKYMQSKQIHMSPGQNRSRRTINLPNRPANLPFSDAVHVGNTLYISGRIGVDPATGLVPPQIDKELEFLFAGFTSVLK